MSRLIVIKGADEGKQFDLTGPCGAEQGNVAIGDQYLFIGVDKDTKLIPTFVIGKRTAENAQMYMQDLSERIVTPMLHEPEPKPQISTDGFAGYPFAVDLAFANTVDYGVLIKDYQESEQPGRYGPPTMTNTVRRVITGRIDKHEMHVARRAE